MLLSLNLYLKTIIVKSNQLTKEKIIKSIDHYTVKIWVTLKAFKISIYTTSHLIGKKTLIEDII